ncbi:hypothetical protein [Lachnoclostridium phytofermentans]|uniref:Butirosin biosynthesis protein H N-terminal domain-containing protein n=1 Tax=Lachnoclostridium phytofermentans (strain ATCC 700394 / DSM 18823 / ISDg) TaxID=357809 RepID=A9KJN8_LACP7|nr:hypothetical protein [Lachnoclostridium phytofermentans]ABX44058.1 hypothetical protein Cphy_3711 [Lachnoclostridium phytofermentans ISDg]
MNVKQSNNVLPNLRQIVHPEYGQNYWLNGCAAYLMECLGQNEFDYSFFAGLTGENFTQVFSKNHFRGNGTVDYCLSEKDNHQFIETIFERCGYASTFVPLKQILSNREMYVQMLMAYIDKGLPVILNDYGNNPHNRPSWGVLVGYSDYGKTLLYKYCFGAKAFCAWAKSIDWDFLSKLYQKTLTTGGCIRVMYAVLPLRRGVKKLRTS